MFKIDDNSIVTKWMKTVYKHNQYRIQVDFWITVKKNQQTCNYNNNIQNTREMDQKKKS